MKRALTATGLLISLAAASACGDDVMPPFAPSTSSTSSSAGSGGGGGGVVGVAIPGLGAKVEATYDPSGVLHLACASDDDCFATLGYFHAQNRFFFMDFIRNLVRGSLGSLVKAGNLVLAQDYVNRQFFTTRQGDPLEAALYANASPEVKAHVDAYARGVNAWIQDMRAGKNGATLTREYDFPLIAKDKIRDWEPEDSAAVGLYVLNDLSNNSPDEIALGVQIPAFDPALVADVFSPAPTFDAFTIPAANMPAPSPPPAPVPGWLAPHRALLGRASEAMKLLPSAARPRQRGEAGSNNWCVGPGRSMTGNALLANDPHLPLGTPSIWFPAEIDAKSAGTGSYHMAGGTFPGLPIVLIGQNESIAWGVTTAYYDLADVYVEQLSTDGSSVKFNGADVPLVHKTYDFQDVSTGMTVSKTFDWVPHHGPVVSTDTATSTAVSVRWRGHDGNGDLDAFFAIGRAASVDEAKKGLEVASSANQNFVVVDTAGNIGWFPYSQVPQRPWASASAPPWLPLPGDGGFEWGDPVPIAELPQLLNPPAGAIATANADMTGATADGDPFNDGVDAIQAIGKADGTRAQRILDLLASGGDTHTLETMSAIQGDTYSLYGSFVVPLVVAAAGGATLTPAEQAVVDALDAWQLTCPTGLSSSDPASAKSSDPVETAESIGCTAFHVVFLAIVEGALGDEAKAAGIDEAGFGLDFVGRALRDPASVQTGDLFWDDVSTPGVTETRDDILRKALTRAADLLGAIGPSDDWRWGRVHTLSLRSIYDSFGVADYNDGPFAAPGGLYTVNVANPWNRSLPAATAVPDLGFKNGPSIRLLVEAAPTGPKMRFALPGGADLHTESPFHNNLLPGWLKNEPVDFAFGPGAVKDPAQVIDVSPAP